MASLNKIVQMPRPRLSILLLALFSLLLDLNLFPLFDPNRSASSSQFFAVARRSSQEDDEFDEFDEPHIKNQPDRKVQTASSHQQAPNSMPNSKSASPPSEVEWDEEDEKEFGTTAPKSRPGHQTPSEMKGESPKQAGKQASQESLQKKYDPDEDSEASDEEFEFEDEFGGSSSGKASPGASAPPPSAAQAERRRQREAQRAAQRRERENEQARQASEQSSQSSEQRSRAKPKPATASKIEEDFETDSEEFESFDSDDIRPIKRSTAGKPGLNIIKVEVPLQQGWQAYWAELLMMLGLVVYIVNLIIGKTKNSRLAHAWYAANKSALEHNFAFVGDDGKSKELPASSNTLDRPGGSESAEGNGSANGGDRENSELAADDVTLPSTVLKETEAVYRLWCTGRVYIQGALFELRFVKRHDLVALCQHWMQPEQDRLIIRVTVEQMDTFVFAVGTKKAISVLLKDYPDITNFASDKKNVDQLGPSKSLQMLSEIGEVTNFFLNDQNIRTFFDKHGEHIEYLHFSDQYTGLKAITDDSQSSKTAPPEPQKVLSFCFTVGKNGITRPEAMSETPTYLKFVFYCVERVRQLNLLPEARAKAKRNRDRVAEEAERSKQTERQEAAQARKEEQRKKERERLLNESDPERARKLEKELEKKEAKKSKGLKVKTLKMKA